MLTNKHTNAGKNITSLADVIKRGVQDFVIIVFCFAGQSETFVPYLHFKIHIIYTVGLWESASAKGDIGNVNVQIKHTNVDVNNAGFKMLIKKSDL